MKKIEVKSLNKSYFFGGEEQKILKNLNISFDNGEFVAIYGASGSGKSTLMNVIGGLDIFQSGEIFIEGKNITEFTNKSMDYYRNRKIGFVFQEFNLLENLSILENVMLPLVIAGVAKKSAKQRATEVLTMVGLAPFIKKKAKNMSGGQKQRIAIARALVNNPDIILADEPTGALDSNTSHEILLLLREIAASGKLVVMITHSKIVSEYATRIVTLKDGIIVENIGYDQNIEQKYIEINAKNKGSKLSLRKAFRIARSNLLSKKFRTFLVSFGVSIGITGSLCIASLSQGTIDSLEYYFSAYERDEQNINSVYVVPTNMEDEFLPIEEEQELVHDTFKDTEGYLGTHPDYVFFGNVVSGRGNDDISEIADVDYSDEEYVTIKSGTYPQNEKEVYYNGDIYSIETLSNYLGVSYPSNLRGNEYLIDTSSQNEYYDLFTEFVDNYIIGKSISFTNSSGETISFKIVGAKEFNYTSMSYTSLMLPYDVSKSFIDSYNFSELTPTVGDEEYEIYYYSTYTIMYDSIENAEKSLKLFSDNIYNFGEIETSNPDYVIGTADFRVIIKIINSIINAIRNVLIALVSISFLVGLFMVTVIVYISTLERKTEIGTLRAIGARKNDIFKIFIAEGIQIGIFAIIMAIIVSLGNILLINLSLKLLFNADTYTTFSLSFEALLVISMAVLFFMFLASTIPAKLAARQNPIDALREE